MNDYFRRNIAYGVAGELALAGYRKYVRPHLERSWNYKGTAAPLILSQKINKMPAVPKKRKANSVLRLRKTKKPKRSRVRVRLGKGKGSVGGYVGGFKKGMSVRKYTRRNKKAKYAMKGFNYTFEVSKLSANSDVVPVGHATFVPLTIYRAAIACLLKKFLFNRGIDIIDVNEKIPGSGATTSLSVSYKTTSSSIVANEVYSNTIAFSITDIVNWWVAVTRPWSSTDAQFVNMTFLGGSMQLTGVKFKIAVTSSFKIQNRSLSLTTDTDQNADQIDAVPLIGRTYEAKGTSLIPRKAFRAATTEPLTLAGDANYGYVDPLGNNVNPIDLAFQDPPEPSAFINCRKVGGAKINPGQINVSVMKDYFTMTFNYLHYTCQALVAPPTLPNPVYGPRERPVGKVRVFFLEKLLNAPVASNGLVNVAWEHNYDMAVTCLYSPYPSLMKQFDKIL